MPEPEPSSVPSDQPTESPAAVVFGWPIPPLDRWGARYNVEILRRPHAFDASIPLGEGGECPQALAWANLISQAWHGTDYGTLSTPFARRVVAAMTYNSGAREGNPEIAAIEAYLLGLRGGVARRLVLGLDALSGLLIECGAISVPKLVGKRTRALLRSATSMCDGLHSIVQAVQDSTLQVGEGQECLCELVASGVELLSELPGVLTSEDPGGKVFDLIERAVETAAAAFQAESAGLLPE